MAQRLRAFFSIHAWKLSFTFKKFAIHWLALFSIIWTFIEFSSYFISSDEVPFPKPPLWAVLSIGVIIAAWMSRPRLTRTVKLKDKDITLRITVDDLFRNRDMTAIIPTNTMFMHEHVDERALQVQLRERCFRNSVEFTDRLTNGLASESHSEITYQGKQIKNYPIGTVIRMEPTIPKVKAAYLVATAELNEYGIGKPNRELKQEGIIALWKYIAEKGKKEPLIIPIVGSGKNRINVSRYELIYDILKTFLMAVKENKFTEELTIVIHPKAFRLNQYSLDDMEEYLRYISKFEVV